MKLSWKNYIRLFARLRKVGKSVSLKDVFSAVEPQEGISISEFSVKNISETTPTLKEGFLEKIKNNNIDKVASKKRKGADYGVDDEASYYDEDILFSPEADGEEAGAIFSKDPLVRGIEEKEEETMLVDEEPEMTAQEKKDRYNLIKERAEQIRKKKLQPQLEVPSEVPNEIVDEPGSDIALRDEEDDFSGEALEGQEEIIEGEETDEEVRVDEEAEQDDVEDKIEENESEEYDEEDDEELEEGPKKRGRKKGTKGEGRSWEGAIEQLEDLRSIAYNPRNLEEYGISEKKQEKIFDLSEYGENEPELWEMADGHIDKAKDSDVAKIKSLIEQAYTALAESEGSNKSILNKSQKEIKKLENIEKLNDMEAKFIIKYLKNKVKELEKKKTKGENKKEAEQERKEDMEMLKKIKADQ